MAGTGSQGLAQFDKSLSELVEEAEDYEKQAESDPAAVSSNIPRLLAFLESSGTEREEIILRDSTLGTIQLLVAHDPAALGSRYPEIVEATLDTQESRVIARSLLHESVELIERDVTVQTITAGFDLAAEKLLEETNTILSKYETESRLPSNGATMMTLKEHLEDYVDSVMGREQLAAEAFIEALSRSIEYHATQQGIDPIDGFVDLQSRYKRESEPFALGFSKDGDIEDMIEADETQSWGLVVKSLIDATLGAIIILSVERTTERILRAEAVIAEQI